MVDVKINNNFLGTQEEVCAAPEARIDKEKVMKKQRVNSMFFSVSDTSKFLAATMTAIGMALTIPHITAIFLGTAATATAPAVAAIPFSLAALGTALVGAPGFGILIAAAAFTAVAIGTQYFSQRFFQSANYDTFELNARHTAKYMAHELKKELDAPKLENEHHCRKDGKAWTQAVSEQAAPQLGR